MRLLNKIKNWVHDGPMGNDLQVSMQTPIPNYANFGATVSSNVQNNLSRLSNEKMHQDTINANLKMHKTDSLLKASISHGSILPELQQDLGINSMNAGILDTALTNAKAGGSSDTSIFNDIKGTFAGKQAGFGVNQYPSNLTLQGRAQAGEINEADSRKYLETAVRRLKEAETGYDERRQEYLDEAPFFAKMIDRLGGKDLEDVFDEGNRRPTLEDFIDKRDWGRLNPTVMSDINRYYAENKPLTFPSGRVDDVSVSEKIHNLYNTPNPYAIPIQPGGASGYQYTRGNR